MCPKLSSVMLVTFLGLFLNSLIVESLPTDKTEEETDRPKVCESRPICGSTAALPQRGLYKCRCDSKCSLYGDCCPESVYYRLSEQLNGKRDVQLFSCPIDFGFYIMDTCPPTFNDDKGTRSKCENVSRISRDYEEDTMMVTPVMEMTSGITYLNEYCALCNGASKFEDFDLYYKCFDLKTGKIVEEEKEEDIKVISRFNSEIESNVNGTDYECFREIKVPDHLRSRTRYCKPEIISSCPKTFTNSNIVKACKHSKSYVVYTNTESGFGDIYKNKYCAQCHDENDWDKLPCQNESSIFRKI